MLPKNLSNFKPCNQTKTPLSRGFVLVTIANLIADRPDMLNYTGYLWKVGPYNGTLLKTPVAEGVSKAFVFPL